jgi:hypothetical protein
VVGDLGDFVKVDSVVFVTQDPVYLFLVSKTADPDFTAVVEAYVIIMTVQFV